MLGTKDNSNLFKQIVWAFFVFIIGVLVLAPIYMLLNYAFTHQVVSYGRLPTPLWPEEFTKKIFDFVFDDVMFWDAVKNSTIIALFTVLLTIIMSIPAGYVLSRYNFPLKRFFLILLISVRLFPDISSVIPIARFFLTNNAVYYIFGFIDKSVYWMGIDKPSPYLSVILAHTMLSLPYVVFMASTAFEFIPKDIEEQASVMGASRFTIFIKILVPIVLPSLVAGAIYTFLLSWDEFIFSHFLLGLNGQIKTLTLYLYDNINQAPSEHVQAAVAVCLSVPVMIFTFIVQRYMVSGMVSGAVK